MEVIIADLDMKLGGFVVTIHLVYTENEDEYSWYEIIDR